MLVSLAFTLTQMLFFIVLYHLCCQDSEELMHLHQMQHVKRLLRTTQAHIENTPLRMYVTVMLFYLEKYEQVSTDTSIRSHHNIASLCCSKPLIWFQRNVYEWDPFFKFPNRIIGTAIISLIGLYTVMAKKCLFFYRLILYLLYLFSETPAALSPFLDDTGRLQSQ